MEADAPYHHPMHTALPFCHYGDPIQIAAVLRRKLELVEQRTERMRRVYGEHIPIVPRGVIHLMISGYEHGGTTADWLRRLIRDAEDGRLYERGTPIEEYPPSGSSPDAGGREPENR